LGQRYELGAARAAGAILMLLAGLFLLEQFGR
jgi:hypothetical protein